MLRWFKKGLRWREGKRIVGASREQAEPVNYPRGSGRRPTGFTSRSPFFWRRLTTSSRTASLIATGTMDAGAAKKEPRAPVV